MTPPSSRVQAERFRLTSSDGLCLACAHWHSRGPARAIVQIAHGMGEHMGRYGDTVDALVAARLLGWIFQTLDNLNDNDRRVSMAPELQH